MKTPAKRHRKSPRQNGKLQLYTEAQVRASDEASWTKYTTVLHKWGVACIRTSEKRQDLGHLATLGLVMELCSHWKIEKMSSRLQLVDLLISTIQAFVKGRPKSP